MTKIISKMQRFGAVWSLIEEMRKENSYLIEPELFVVLAAEGVERDARKLTGVVIIKDDNPYDMEEMLMPLHKYLNTPTAHDIIHNGVTFQIAGLTNNSHLSEVRHCVQKYKNLGAPVLQVAKKRLDGMLYVGLTEEHRESASLFANVVGSQVLTQVVTSNITSKTTKSEASVTIPESGSDKSEIQNGTSEVASSKIEAKSGNMTVKTLMEVYEGCITRLRKSQGIRRVNSLKRISPANFTRKDSYSGINLWSG